MDRLSRYELFSLAIQLELPELIAMCKTSNRFNEAICEQDPIWRYRLERDYPDHERLQKTLPPREKYQLLHQLSTLKTKLNASHDIYELYQVSQVEPKLNSLEGIYERYRRAQGTILRRR